MARHNRPNKSNPSNGPQSTSSAATSIKPVPSSAPLPTINAIDNVVPTSSPSSTTSHTLTPVTARVPSFEWVVTNRRPHPCTTEIATEDGAEIRTAVLFDVEGTVTDSYLRADAFSHSISIRLSLAAMDEIKRIVRTAPGHNDVGFRWPFENGIAKFTHKPDGDTPLGEFNLIFDGRAVDLNNFGGDLEQLGIEDVNKGSRVSLEYTPVPYPAQKQRQHRDGYPAGCTLQLRTITLIEQGPVVMVISSPSKRRRIH